MKRISLFIIVIIAISIIINNNSHAQNLVITLNGQSNVQSTKPEKVYSIVKVDKPLSWFKDQAELWKKETKKNQKNADAWYNYYKAMRYVKILSDTNYMNGLNIDNELNNIIKQMEAKVPNSYEFNLLKYTQGGMDLTLFPYLKKAFEIDPDRIDAYSDLSAYYEAVRDTSNLKSIMIKWYKSNDFSPGLMTLNYNELMSLEKNAILFVNGDNMYYPKKALQYALGIRCDVKIVLECFLDIPSYRDSIFKELNLSTYDKNIVDFKDDVKYSQAIIDYITKNVKGKSIYFSVASGHHYYEKIRDYLYNEGLVLKYSTEKYDNVAIIKRNYEKIFMKDYLCNNFTNDISQSIVYHANLNYTPSFMILYQHYKVSGDNDKANEIKEIIYGLYEHMEYYEENVFIQLKEYFDEYDKKE